MTESAATSTAARKRWATTLVMTSPPATLRPDHSFLRRGRRVLQTPQPALTLVPIAAISAAHRRRPGTRLGACGGHKSCWEQGRPAMSKTDQNTQRAALTRRSVLGWGAVGAAKPYKLGCTQPLTGVAASGGKTALVGVQMAVDRINKAGGINGRPVDLIVADDQSKPDIGRRAAEKLVTEDNIDFHVGGFLSNICLACTPVWEEHEIVNMIGVCLDTTLTTSKCSRYTFRNFDFAPAQAKAFAP